MQIFSPPYCIVAYDYQAEVWFETNSHEIWGLRLCQIRVKIIKKNSNRKKDTTNEGNGVSEHLPFFCLSLAAHHLKVNKIKRNESPGI